MSQDETPSKASKLSDKQLFKEMVKFFGFERMVFLTGWVVFASVVYDIQNKRDSAALVAKLKESGQSHSAIYRALTDMRRFADYIEERPEPKRIPRNGHDETLSMMARLASLSLT